MAVRGSWAPPELATWVQRNLHHDNRQLWRGLVSTALMQGALYWASDKIMKITSAYLSTIMDAPMTSRHFKSMKVGIKWVIESEVQVFKAIPPLYTACKWGLTGLATLCRGTVRFLNWQPKSSRPHKGHIIHRRKGELRNLPNSILATRITTFLCEFSLVGVQAFLTRRWAAAFLEAR